MINQYKDEIIENCLKTPNEEACGLVALKDDCVKILNCKNIHTNKVNNFLISEGFKVHDKNTIAIWHSHVNKNETPSVADVEYSEALGIPFCIFSNLTKEFYLHFPNSHRNGSFKSRKYLKGFFNCGTLIVDYFKTILKKEIITEGVNFYKENKAIKEIEKKHFIEVKSIGEIKKNDVLKFKIKNDKFHFGVYLGNQIFFHQMDNTLPYKRQLENKWMSRVYKILRYKDR